MSVGHADNFDTLEGPTSRSALAAACSIEPNLNLGMADNKHGRRQRNCGLQKMPTSSADMATGEIMEHLKQQKISIGVMGVLGVVAALGVLGILYTERSL